MSLLLALTAAVIPPDIVPTNRGDDGGFASSSGLARKAIYDRQLAEFKEEVEQRPKKKAKRQKIEALEEKLVLIEDRLGLEIPDFDFSRISDALAGFAVNEIDYAAFQHAVLAHLADIEIELAIQKRKRLHKNIALAMLVHS